MRFFEDAPKLPAVLAYHGQAYKHLMENPTFLILLSNKEYE